MKITYPSKEEVGAWLTGIAVCCAGGVAGKRDFSAWILPGVAAWAGLSVCALLFLTIRATVRKRRDVAGE